MALLRLTNIRKAYKEQHKARKVLDDVSFEVGDEEVVSIIGPNGSGKSTLFQLALGIVKPDAGEIVMHPSAPRFGFVFQNYRDSLMPWSTVLNNVLLPLEESLMPKEEKMQLAHQALADVGLEKFAHFYIYQLSGGMSQLVALARALITEPEILLLDEPFSALDYVRTIKMQEMLAGIWQKKRMTTLLISHDIDEAIYLSDRIVVLSGSPAEVRKVIKVDLPRPRTFHVRVSEEFEKLRSTILRIIETNEISL